jgi:hypothetical protein
VARFVLHGGVVSAKAPPSVLVLAVPGDESDALVADLARREDLCLLRVATAAAANHTIQEMPVALVIACPATPVQAIDAVLAQIAARRRGTPVIAVRHRKSPERAAWVAQGVAVLRMPLVPGVLSRSVDVVLGMQGKLQKGSTR